MQVQRPRILCAVTSDDLAGAVVATARRIAEQGDYETHFLHAWDLPSRTAPMYRGAVPAVPVYSRESMARQAAEAGEALLHHLSIDPGHADNVPGDPVSEIRAKAEAICPDLIVLGSRGHGPLAGALVGSVTRALAGEGRWPLLVVNDAESRGAGGPVVCGIAPPLSGALEVAETAAAFARRLGKSLVLAHVSDLPGPGYIVDAGGFPSAPGAVLPVTRPHGTAGGASTSVLSDVADRLGDAGAVRTVSLEGSPGEALAVLAGEEGAEAIVVGRRRRGALRTAIEGSVSLDLIRESEIPVMVVPGAARVSDDHGPGDS